MSMFFFDCFDGENHHPDQYGIDLATEAEARDQATALLQSLVAEASLDTEARSIAVTVRAASGLAIYAARCSFTGRWTEDRAPPSSAPDRG